MQKLLAVVAVAGFSVGIMQAQSVLAAKAGTIHTVDGKAWISGKAVKPLKTGEFPALEEGQSLSTADAHAEVLLTPGVFLRIGAETEVELVSAALTDVQIRLLKGSALIEAGEVLKDNRIRVDAGEYRTTITKFGLYRFDAEPARVRVFDGRADVRFVSDSADAKPLTLKRGREVTGGKLNASVKFDSKLQDELFAWSNRRSAVIAQANLTAARSAVNGGNGKFYRGAAGNWVFLPSFGFYTYMPGNGRYYSPFGYFYYSPLDYYTTYIAPPMRTIDASSGPSGPSWSGLGSNSGYNSSGSGGGSYSSVAATSAPTRSEAPAPAAPAASGGRGD